MSRLVAFAASLVAASCPAIAASIQYDSPFHADDVGIGADTAHDESPAFGQTAATLRTASSTSHLAGSDAGFSFDAFQSRADTDGSWVHTLAYLSFTPAVDVPFVFAGSYDVRRAPSTAQTNVSINLQFVGSGPDDPDLHYDVYGRISGPSTFTFPAPAQTFLRANHTYVVTLESFNETYLGLDGGTTADVHLALTALPLPPAAVAGTVALAALFVRRRFAAPAPA